MALEMKGVCERCEAKVQPDGEAYVCSYECTFCPACTRDMQAVCPNCGGELVRRPKRKRLDAAIPSAPSRTTS